MHKYLLSILLLIFLKPVISNAQGIGSVLIQYQNPAVSNNLELIAQILIPSQPAYRINNQARISNDTLYVTACYYAGMAAAPTTFTDTIPLGSISLNLTTLHFKISYSTSTQCNIVNSTTKIQAFQIRVLLGIKPLSDKPEISFYPNPATDFLFVKNQNYQSIILRELTGKILQKKNFQPEQNLQLDLSTLDKGVYLAELISDNASFQNNVKTGDPCKHYSSNL